MIVISIKLYFEIREKQLDQGNVLRPVQGPKKKFEHASEENMVEYIDFCWEIGIPKTEEMFSEELVHFMEYNGIRNTFPKVKPGKHYNFEIFACD